MKLGCYVLRKVDTGRHIGSPELPWVHGHQKGKGNRFFLNADVREHRTLPTPGLLYDCLPPELGINEYLLFVTTQLTVLCRVGPRKPIHSIIAAGRKIRFLPWRRLAKLVLIAVRESRSTACI